MKNALKTFPEELKNLLSVKSQRRMNYVIPIITTGERLNVALLSPYQVVLIDDKTIFVSVNEGSHTFNNLKSDGKCALIIFFPPKAYYIYGRASHLKGKVFRMDVDVVEEDYSEEAPILTVPTFSDDKVRGTYEEEFKNLLLTFQEK